MTDFTLNAEVRSDLGKGASRRLRRNANLVPAVIYGGDKAPQSISLLNNQLVKALENDAFFSSVITLNVAGTTESVVIKALQRHPSKGFVLHADFQRVVAGQKLTAHVAVRYLNEETCIGVKQQGGEVYRVTPELEVSCLPKDLPDFIDVDVANLEVGQNIHLSDLTLPAGVELVALAHGNDLVVANVKASRVQASEEGAAE
ncbi:50S ribosomal protein L25/general stress protein Ctc [Pseudomonas sp. NCCP-436]|uniref:50S ribosomal protein L25/general stress protein Ctc n=1 Tax=Pseudomonas sp. NCCP-436 TaxID=2842481 RepID=UPI001C805E76|nr:50S ribosomal protein L25/general stress protein Ctc [Pseudomonas sp. NCCP-436]GIZ11066.1 50S ribosomal protein L25 [Pseudomonas sp. NCCP-436]